MPIRSRVLFVFHWAVIAIEHETQARKGRGRAVEERLAGMPQLSSDEFYAAMPATAACTHALEALYAELAEHVTPETLAKWETARRRDGRAGAIAAVLELAVNVDVEAWRPRLKTLFEERRNPVVHPKVRWRDLVEHPALGMIDADRAAHTVEAVQESVDLLLEILTACVEAPKPSIEEWAAQLGGFGLHGMVEYLTELRGRRRAEFWEELQEEA
jgi:hypothetical protein